MSNSIFLKRRTIKIEREESRGIETKAEAGGDTVKQTESQKANILKDLIIEALKDNDRRRVLILVENMYDEEEMNKILQPVITVMAIALTTSDQADPTHLMQYGGGVSTLTRVLEFRSDNADEFARAIDAIRVGKYKDDNNNILVLYSLDSNVKRDGLGSNYVIFAVGREVNSAIQIIEDRLGTAAVKFRAPIENAGSTWVVLMIPLTIGDLKNCPIQIPQELLKEIEKKVEEIQNEEIENKVEEIQNKASQSSSQSSGERKNA